jgi:hypothetical protein
VREKPIPFSTEMVRAILEGRKTMTRRVIKPQPPEGIGPIVGPEMFEPAITDKYGELKEGKPIFGVYDEWGEWGTKCPYQPGDTLWVRETWRNGDCSDKHYNCGRTVDTCDIWRQRFMYLADGDPCADKCKWRPPIHMPREASRIRLLVKRVGVERVQDITPYDAWNEGCRIGNSFPWEQHIPELQQQCRDVVFRGLWDSIYEKRGFGWDANPWVWVIEFKREAVGG